MRRYIDDDGYICIRDGVYLTRYWQNGEVKEVIVDRIPGCGK